MFTSDCLDGSHEIGKVFQLIDEGDFVRTHMTFVHGDDDLSHQVLFASVSKSDKECVEGVNVWRCRRYV